MFSQIPFDPNRLENDTVNRVVLRISIMQALDTINLFDELSDITHHTRIQKFFSNLAEEEKVHLGESLAMLLEFDPKQYKDLQTARDKIQKEMKIKPDI